MSESLSFDTYFDIAEELYGGPLRCEVRQQSGVLVAANTPALLTAELEPTQSPTGNRLISNDASRKVLREENLPSWASYRTDIQLRSGDVWGVCAFSIPTDIVAVAEQKLVGALTKIVPLIENEIRLSSELDSMADELAGRYEQLNLVYESVNESSTTVGEGEMLNRIIDDCFEYLEVDLVAFVMTHNNQIYCRSGNESNISEPSEVILALQPSLLEHFKNAGRGLIVNSIADPQRGTLRIDLPYKVLACAVQDADETVHGVLLCVNRQDRKDFFNGDRSLLQVVAQKIAKLIQSNRDPLTGLMNRRAVEAKVADAIDSARDDGAHAFLHVDLAQMQVVNETHGRSAGDGLIAHVGAILKAELRHHDSIGYLGEGRFAILLERCDGAAAKKVAEKLQQVVSDAPLEWSGKRIDATVTTGIVSIERSMQEVSEVLAAAEIATYAAKDHGVGSVRLYSREDTELSARKERMHWVTQVQLALREDRFELYAQEIRPVGPSAERYHFEVLLRMHDEEGGLVSPGLFIPAAEEFNLMPTIDQWVIDRLLRQAADSGFGSRAGEGVMSVNLSGQSLSNDHLTRYIIEKLAFYRIDPSCVCFEITETAAIDSIESAHSVLNALKQHGCALSLDDFGTGLSSFTYLRTMPVDYVKIDGSFVKSVLEDEVSRAMVSSINDIGHVMHLRTVAEFVENETIQREIESIGVDYLQGYGIAKPIPLTDYVATLESTRKLAQR